MGRRRLNVLKSIKHNDSEISALESNEKWNHEKTKIDLEATNDILLK